MLANCARCMAGVGFSLSEMSRRRAELREQLARRRGVGRELLAVEMRLRFADQPFLRIPGAVGAPAGDALDASARTDILIAEGDELGAREHLDVEEAAGAARARLGAVSLDAASFGALNLGAAWRAAFAGFAHGAALRVVFQGASGIDVAARGVDLEQSPRLTGRRTGRGPSRRSRNSGGRNNKAARGSNRYASRLHIRASRAPSAAAAAAARR